MPLRCLLVEDHLMFRQMLQAMLRSMPGLEVVATAGSEQEGITACGLHNPDLLILDLALPDGHGLNIARHLAESRPLAKVIILSGEASTFVCPDDLHRHIHAVVDKTHAFESLRIELEALLPAEGARTTKAGPAGTMINPGDVLSPKEREIFSLIGQGLPSKQIADRMGISKHTVQAHRKRIALKLGTVGDELSHMAVRHQVDPASAMRV